MSHLQAFSVEVNLFSKSSMAVAAPAGSSKGTRNNLVTKKRIHLLQRSTLGIWVEGRIADCGHDVEHKECIEMSEPDRVKGDWRGLSNDQPNTPVRDGSQRISSGPDLDRENFSIVDIRDDTHECEEERIETKLMATCAMG
jgi:hypothetical protein